MKMVGHQYFRCGKKFYKVPLDSNIILQYRIDRNGNITDTDHAYSMINTNMPFLSPYVTWTFHLSGDDSEIYLEKIKKIIKKKPIDWNLIGKGKYTEEIKWSVGTFSHMYCGKQMDDYYQLNDDQHS